jgi:hypothetical protein
MTLGCGEARLERVPSAQMIASPVKTPRRPSSQLTSTPCLVQAFAIAGPAAHAAAADRQTENTSWSCRPQPIDLSLWSSMMTGFGFMDLRGVLIPADKRF